MTLGELLATKAEAFEGATARPAVDGTEWLAAGRAFALIEASGKAAAFRLEPVVARAALGTPDTAPSTRGPDWVAFTPPVVDQFAGDRAAAWLASAYRHAVRGSAAD